MERIKLKTKKWVWNWYLTLQIRMGIFLAEICNCLRKHEGLQPRLVIDLYFGLTESRPRGCSRCVCDLQRWLTVQRHERRRAVKCVFSDRDEWRDRCGRCQSDNLASVSPGDPEEPSGWTRWTACCGEREWTTERKKVKLIRHPGPVDCLQSCAMIRSKI